MSERAYLPLSLVLDLEPHAEAEAVSVVARGRTGFLRAYEAAAGDSRALGPMWRIRRRGFLARHLAQAKAHGEGWWTPGGEPTRRHLALAMWAWSPTPERLERYAKEHPSAHVGMVTLRRFYDRQARLALQHEIRKATPIPRLRIETASDWGGRFVPAAAPAIELYPAKTLAMNRAIVVHELAHWVRHHTGDPKGYHDEAFCRLLSRMYGRAGVGVEAARAVETIGGCLS